MRASRCADGGRPDPRDWRDGIELRQRFGGERGVGAEPYERTEERATQRNGYRERRFDTRLRTLNLKIPKVREGGFVPSFIEHRKRGEQALISVIQEAVIQGVSTRKIEAVLAAFGIAGISAAQVSQLCSSPDEKVRRFRERPLGECRYVWVDALYEKVREDERVESMAVESKDFVWLRSRGAGGILDMLRRYPSSLCTFPKRIVRAAADHQSVPVEIQNV